MELREFIERAEIAAGSQKALGEIIGQNPSHIRNAKSGKQGLPAYACVLIADLIGEDEIIVIAASELATEKHANRRAIWKKKLEAIAAGLLLASVTSLVTPTPAQAAPLSQVIDSTLYIMSNTRKRFIAMFLGIRRIFFPPCRFSS